VELGETVSRTGLTKWVGGGLRATRLGKLAAIPEIEHGATLAHWLAGQWEQSECAGRLTKGALAS
jgi:hypothetical protein